MSIEELICELQKYPPHFMVDVRVVQCEDADLQADIVDVKHDLSGKVVSLRLDGRPS